MLVFESKETIFLLVRLRTGFYRNTVSKNNRTKKYSTGNTLPKTTVQKIQHRKYSTENTAQKIQYRNIQYRKYSTEKYSTENTVPKKVGLTPGSKFEVENASPWGGVYCSLRELKVSLRNLSNFLM